MKVRSIRCAFYLTGMLAALVFNTTAQADRENDDDRSKGDMACPVEYYNGIPMDVEFGPGTQEITHCLQVRHKAKVVVAIDNTHPTDKNGITKKDKATFLSNVDLMIKNYEQVHGMKIGKDIKVAVVGSASGALLLTKTHKAWGIDALGHPMPNPFAALVQKGIDAGMKFYLCQMAARELGIKRDTVLDGVAMVPGGHIAVADLQMRGYALIKP